MNNTKAKYKEYVKHLTAEERQKERDDIRLQLMKAQIDSSRGLNPYQRGKKGAEKTQYNPKLLRWKLKQLIF